MQIFRAGNTGPTAHKLGGKDLPHGLLSSYVENKVKARLKDAYEAEAKEQGVEVEKVQWGMTTCCGCLLSVM